MSRSSRPTTLLAAVTRPRSWPQGRSARWRSGWLPAVALLVGGLIGLTGFTSGKRVSAADPVTSAVVDQQSAAGPNRRSNVQDAAGDVRDVLLLLDSGPLHLRFRLALSGESLTARRDQYIDRLFASLDINHDGKLVPDERRRSPLFTARRKKFDNPFLSQLEDGRAATRGDLEKDLARFGAAELVSFRQDDSAAENDLEVFKVLDVDGNGRIEPAEMGDAAPRLAAFDQDEDECISFDEFRAPVIDANPGLVLGGVGPADPRTQPKATPPELIRQLTEPLLPRQLMRKYDRNRDSQLTADELGWDAERLATIDANRDQQLSLKELQQLDRLPVDLELAVDVGLAEASAESVRIVSSASDRRVPSPRPDLVRLQFGSTGVTFSYRAIDPMTLAAANAMTKFNSLDMDANGYIDRTEMLVDSQFVNYFFDAMDTDQDGKVFVEEMLVYVKAVCEPAGTTCQINLYDTGPGFFQLVDTNGDGRISIRELRGISDSLVTAAGGPGRELSRGRAAHQFHVEFVRGSYQLFGRTERMVAQGPTFVLRPPVGPTWFQRMDRNSDGDLTWQEFLGPREAFSQLDRDQDGLVSVSEAETFRSPQRSQAFRGTP